MRWKIRCGSTLGARVPAEVLEDARLTDGAVRTYVWLQTLVGVDVDPNEHGKRRRIGYERVRGQLEELEKKGYVKTREDEDGVVVEVPQADADPRANVLAVAAQRHQKETEKIQARRAARHVAAKPSGKVSKPARFTSKSLEGLWRDCWEEKWPDRRIPSWSLKEYSIAKKFIELLGEEDSKKAVEQLIKRWEECQKVYRLNGNPTVQVMMGFRQTMVMSLIEGRPLGNVKPDARQRALVGSEYDERTAAKEPDVGW